MTPVYFSPEAEDDLKDIWGYLSQYGADIADDFVARVAKICDRLERFPRSGAAMPDLRPDLRCVPLDHYRFFYRIGEAGVEIARIIHAKRDSDAIFKS